MRATIQIQAVLLKGGGKWKEAEELYREALEGRRLSLGPAHPMTIRSMNNLANLLDAEAEAALREGKLADAAGLFHQAADLWEHHKGEAHPDVVRCRQNTRDAFAALALEANHPPSLPFRENVSLGSNSAIRAPTRGFEYQPPQNQIYRYDENHMSKERNLGDRGDEYQHLRERESGVPI